MSDEQKWLYTPLHRTQKRTMVLLGEQKYGDPDLQTLVDSAAEKAEYILSRLRWRWGAFTPKKGFSGGTPSKQDVKEKILSLMKGATGSNRFGADSGGLAVRGIYERTKTTELRIGVAIYFHARDGEMGDLARIWLKELEEEKTIDSKGERT